MRFWKKVIAICMIAAAPLAVSGRVSSQTCQPESRCSQKTSNCADCLTCANDTGEYCSLYYDACVASSECVYYAAACEYLLPADPHGYAACIDAHPVGAALYAALIDCMVCVQCPGCDPWDWVDPHPGCGE